MSENEPNPNVNTELPPPDSMRTMSDLLGLMTFREYVDKVRAGLKEPKDSGEYKYARNQLLRVWAPVAGTVLPLIMVLAVALAPEPSAPPVTAFTVTMLDTKELEEEIEEIIIEPLPEEKIEEIEPPPLQELKPVDIQNMTDDQLLSGAVGPSVGPGSGTGA
ncbi:MAG: hypothetical protein O3B24_05145, partial [Verrucomicrobia bacterium]|nr:hypothetical protein [Verrucomicrobiota bacterium]